MRTATPLLLAIAAIATPGCIVQDIHDQIALSNENLTSIHSSMGDIDAKLEGMNDRIDALERRLDQTNKHLESLRKTINNIDSTIPFLKLSGDDEEDKAELEGEGDGPPEAPAAHPPQESAPPATEQEQPPSDQPG